MNNLKRRTILFCVLLVVIILISGCSDNKQQLKQYEVNIDIDGSGSVSKEPNQSTYILNTKVELNAIAEENWKFKEWRGNLTGADNPATIIVEGDMNITAVFESIINNLPVANDETVTTDEDIAVKIDVLGNDSDSDGDNLSISVLNDGNNGTTVGNEDGTVTYTPAEDFNGEDSFDYEIDDGNGGKDTATVTITVNSVNDSPVLEEIGNIIAHEGEEMTFILSASDVDGDNLTYRAYDLPNEAVFNELTREFSWTPDYGTAGNYNVRFEVSDGELTVSEEITITVGEVDRPPVLDPIGDQGISEGEELKFTVSASDPDGDTVNLSAENLPAGSDFNTETGQFSWTPDYEGQAGTYDVTYKAEANGLTDEETITITVYQLNYMPTANNDDVAVDEDGTVLIDVLVNDTDVDGDTLSITGFTQGTNGTVSQEGDSLRYTPDADFNGTDNFTYDIGDGKGGIGTATVNMTINAINDVPVPGDDSGELNQDGTILIDVLANDTDIDGDTLGIIGFTQGSNGVVAQEGDSLRYTPDAGYYGIDSFTYDISDGNGGMATATVNITVNSSIILSMDIEDNDGDTGLIAFDITASDTYKIETSYYMEAQDTILYLYSDINGTNLITENDDYSSLYACIIISLEPGTYYVRVQNWDIPASLYCHLEISPM